MLISHRIHNFNNNAVCLPLCFLCFKLLATPRFYSKNLKTPIFPNKTLKPYKALKPYGVLNVLRFQKNPEIALQIFMSAAQKPRFKHLRSSYDVLVDKLAKSNKYGVIENFLEGLKRGKSSGETLVAVIRLYGRARMPQNALETFFQMPDFNCKHTVTAFNSLLNALVNSEKYEIADQMYKNRHQFGIYPDIYTYNILIRAKCEVNLMGSASVLFGLMCKQGLSPDTVTYNTLMSSFLKAGEINKVYKILSEMSRNRCVSDAGTYGIIIDSFRKEGKMNEALIILNEMLREGHRPNIFTLNTMLRSFCENNMVHVAKMIFSEMPRKGCNPNVVSHCILIEGMCKDGQVSSAYELFRLVLAKRWVPNEDTCKTMAETLYETGRFKEAVRVADEMDKWNFVPDTRTWDALVNSWLNSS